jgi:chromosome segregation ATPase
MEQFSQFEGRIKDALERISVSIEHVKSSPTGATSLDQDASNQISELTAVNKQLEIQLQSKDSQEAREISELRAQLVQLERDRREDTQEMQRLYDQLAIALSEGTTTIGEDA